jgi:TP901 family phage tail tape measure protein
MANLTSKLIVSLVDRVSAPAKGIAASVRGLDNQLTKMRAANARSLSRLQGQMVGAVAAAYSLHRALSSPLKAAADFETALLDIAQKADLGDGAMKSLGDRIRKLAPLLNQSAGGVAKGVDFLAGMGLDPDRAMTLMGPIGRAATAYKAEIEDLAKSGFAVLDNLKVKADDFGRALDVMAQSGKEGAFELADMARFFPSLTAAAQALKITGVDGVAKLAAALQIARKGAADGSEAATNAANLMQKIVSPETTKKFQKLGVNIRKELKKTQDSGGDVFEMIAKLTDKALKGDMSKLGDLFEDAQVQKFLRPLIANLEEYRKIRDKSGAANGVVDQDFDRRMKTAVARTAAFTNQLNDLAITIGNILLPAMNGLLGKINPIVKSFERFAEANPGLVGGGIKAAAALIALRIAAIGVRFAMAFMGAAMLTALAPIQLFPKALALMGAGILALTRPLQLLKLALLGTGIGAILVGIGTAAVFLANNAKGITAFFSSMTTALKEGLQGDRFKFMVEGLERIGNLWKSITGEIATSNWEAWGSSTGASLAQSINSIADALDRVIASWQKLQSIWNSTIGFITNTEPATGLPASSSETRKQRWRDRGKLPMIGAPAGGGDVWSSGASPFRVSTGRAKHPVPASRLPRPTRRPSPQSFARSIRWYPRRSSVGQACCRSVHRQA